MISRCINTGADTTCLSVDIVEQLLSTPLSLTNKALRGLYGIKLDVISSFTTVLEWHNKKSPQVVYVLWDVHQALLRRDAIDTLGMIKRLDVVSRNSEAEVKRQYHNLCTSLGCMDGGYTI